MGSSKVQSHLQLHILRGFEEEKLESEIMGIKLMRMIKGKMNKNRVSPGGEVNVPKGHFPVYVGENEKRFVLAISYLNNPLFQNLLKKAEEEFGLDRQLPVGGLRVLCSEEAFLELLSTLKCSH